MSNDCLKVYSTKFHVHMCVACAGLTYLFSCFCDELLLWLNNIIFCAHSFITNYVKRSNNVITAFLLCESKCAFYRLFSRFSMKKLFMYNFSSSVSFHLVFMAQMLFATKWAFYIEKSFVRKGGGKQRVMKWTEEMWIEHVKSNRYGNGKI